MFPAQCNPGVINSQGTGKCVCHNRVHYFGVLCILYITGIENTVNYNRGFVIKGSVISGLPYTVSTWDYVWITHVYTCIIIRFYNLL